MNTPPLLPSDKYLASLLGLSEEEFRWFRAEVRAGIRIEPGKPQAGLEPISWIVIGLTIISVGLTIAASFFKPKEGQGTGPDIRTKNKQGNNVSTNQRFAPRQGFDTVQEPARIGATIPLVYANRADMAAQSESVVDGMVIPARPAGKYGGVRVNMELLWSQMWSLQGSQLLRAVFMIGEGTIASIDPKGFAIGDNTIGGYELDNQTQSSSRLSVYTNGGDGRIGLNQSNNEIYVAGRTPDSDIGNAKIAGGPDVFCVKTNNNTYTQNFCFTSKPSVTTQFGLHQHIPNNFSFRINPRVRPTITLKTKPSGDEHFRAESDDDAQALADIWKSKYSWSCRSGIIAVPDVSRQIAFEGEEILYYMSSASDAKKRIKFNDDNTDNESRDADGKAKCGDVGLGVSARQRAADDSLEIGQLYKIGSCVAILINRSASPDGTQPDEVFVSQADSTNESEGQSMFYRFRAVKTGWIGSIVGLNDIDYEHDQDQENSNPNVLTPPQWSQPGNRNLSAYPSRRKFNTATKFPQIFKCAIATIIVPGQCQVFELGFRSQVGIRVNGFCNLRDCPTLQEVNRKAGYKFHRNRYKNDTRLGIAIYSSGTLQTVETRYSFFRIEYRESGTSVYTPIIASFGIRSITSQAIYSYLRIVMPSSKQWEIRIEPLSGFEIRNGFCYEPLIVLDPKGTTERGYSWPSGISVYWTGVIVNRSRSTFRFRALEPAEDIGFGFTDDVDMTDDWGRLAEAFAYDEIQASTANGPEHEIVYVNTIRPLTTTAPSYHKIHTIGLNIKAATEWSQFSQFSAYVSGGMQIRRLNDNSVGASHLFPNILFNLLTSTRYGVGAAVSEDQIDIESFQRARLFCDQRRYYYDGVIPEKINLRQWAADVAGTMLLELVQRNGKWGLEPAVLFSATGTTGKLPIRGLFTAGNIVENSFQLEFLEEAERLPIQVSVKWREERVRDNYSSPGAFPVEREVLVREAFRPDTDPIETFDLSDYVTNLEHAIDFACYVIRVRNLITHSVKFNTTPDGIMASLAAGDYIQVAMDITYYDEYAMGVVLDTGKLVTTRPDLLPPGTHIVTTWAGGQDELIEQQMTVNTDGTATPTGVMFIRKSLSSHLRTYKIESISIDPEGVISIEAVHHPTDTDGKSLITRNWTTYATDANWVIETG